MVKTDAIYTQIIQSIHAGLLVINLEKTILFANEPAPEIFRSNTQDLLKKTIQDIFPTPLVDSFTQSLKKVQKTKKPVRVEHVTLVENRQKHFVGYTAYPLRESSTMPVAGIIVSGRDITKLIRMEKRFQKAQKLATISQLLLTFHHEIRNPLTGIVSSSRILKGSKNLPESTREKLLNLIQESSEKLEKTMDRFSNLKDPRLEDYPGGHKIFKLPTL